MLSQEVSPRCGCCLACPDCHHHDDWYDVGEFEPIISPTPCGSVSPFTNACPHGRCQPGYDAAMCQRRWRLAQWETK